MEGVYAPWSRIEFPLDPYCTMYIEALLVLVVYLKFILGEGDYRDPEKSQ
jgi:hypothetical protein